MDASSKNIEIIGSTELVEVAGIKNIPAKTDTGADSSAIWASNIDMEKDGTLVFSLFGEKSPFYTGERLSTKDYKVKSVRSSNGAKQIRYRITLPIKIGSKAFDTAFTLANRSTSHFPILIGRHTIEGNFLVDVTKMAVPLKKSAEPSALSQKMQEDPYEFHKKYVK